MHSFLNFSSIYLVQPYSVLVNNTCPRRCEKHNGTHYENNVLIHSPFLIKGGNEFLMLFVNISFCKLQQISSYVHIFFGMWHLLWKMILMIRYQIIYICIKLSLLTFHAPRSLSYIITERIIIISVQPPLSNATWSSWHISRNALIFLAILIRRLIATAVRLMSCSSFGLCRASSGCK